MTNQNDEQSKDARLEHFDNPELGSGARDTGQDTPEPQQEGRPVGTVDEDANPPMSDPSASNTYGGTGESPPKTPVGPSRHTTDDKNPARSHPQAPRAQAVQPSAARAAPSAIPITSRPARRTR